MCARAYGPSAVLRRPGSAATRGGCRLVQPCDRYYRRCPIETRGRRMAILRAVCHSRHDACAPRTQLPCTYTAVPPSRAFGPIYENTLEKRPFTIHTYVPGTRIAKHRVVIRFFFRIVASSRSSDSFEAASEDFLFATPVARRHVDNHFAPQSSRVFIK